MPLNIKGHPTDIATTNRWALGIENQLASLKQQTHAIPNIAQKVVALNPTPAPIVTVPVTDGLVHGDAIWEIDPAYIILRDDFATPNSQSTLGDFVSELSWHGANGSGASFQSVVNGSYGPPPVLGAVTMLNNGTASNSNFLNLLATPATVPQAGWPLLDYPGWKLVWIFGVSRSATSVSTPPAFSWTKVSFYLGLGNTPNITTSSSSSPRPLNFLGLRYDTDTTAPSIADSQFVFEYVAQTPVSTVTRNNTQGTTFATGITATEGTIYRLEIQCVTSGSVTLSLSNGATTSTTTLSISPKSASFNPTVAASNGVGIFNSGSLTLPWVPGTKVGISGGSVAAFNGNFVVMEGVYASAVNSAWFMPGTVGSATSTGATMSYYPALYPWAAFGNDSTASPTAGSKGIFIDFFGFVWNPGVGSRTGTPNPNHARYF